MHPLLPVGVISINFRRSGVIFTKKKKEEEEEKLDSSENAGLSLSLSLSPPDFMPC